MHRLDESDTCSGAFDLYPLLLTDWPDCMGFQLLIGSFLDLSSYYIPWCLFILTRKSEAFWITLDCRLTEVVIFPHIPLLSWGSRRLFTLHRPLFIEHVFVYSINNYLLIDDDRILGTKITRLSLPSGNLQCSLSSDALVSSLSFIIFLHPGDSLFCIFSSSRFWFATE